jgi:hypothetical protein
MKFFFLAVSFFCAPKLFAQTFGNEWIQNSQIYYKFSLAKEGIYRISYEQMKSAGIEVDLINPKGIQIFTKGREVALLAVGESDNAFDPGDYIEFYGTYNDGALDQVLYQSPAEQPHAYSSLYTDSLTYFLTWTGGNNGKRMVAFSNTNYSGKTPDSYFLYKSIKWFKDAWFDGSPFAGGYGLFSEYTEGEGWFSSPYFEGGDLHSITTPDYIVSGPAPKLHFKLFGKSDPVVSDAQGYNHEVEVRAGNSLDVIYTEKFKGYAKIEQDLTLLSSQMDVNTKVKFTSSYLSKGRQAVSSIDITYPRGFNLNNSSQFRFSYNSLNSYLKFSNYPSGKSNPKILDLGNDLLIDANVSGNDLQFNIPVAGVSDLFIYDSVDAIWIDASAIKPVSFNLYDFTASNYDFLIISNEKLDSAVSLYADYRNSAEGGGHNVFVAYTSQLYDQFYYGIHHPMALRNFCFYILSTQPQKPEFLFLIGKGQRYSRITFDANNRNQEDLVPTFGDPPSDYPFTSGLAGTQLEPAIPTGRIPCRTLEQLINYLEKVKLYEKLGPEPWRKNVIHLAGGMDFSESQTFNSYLTEFYNILKGPFFGGKRKLFSKGDAVPVDKSLTSLIQEEIARGVSMVTYFGHGSAQVLEVEIGEVKDFDNAGKYPLFYFNGCALGNSFEQYSIPESFLFEPLNGAISWVASTTFGFTGELYQYGRIFHNNIFKDNFGLTIAQNLKKTIEQYQNPASNYNRTQSRQLIYLGDPAIKIFSPDKPDYITEPSGVSVYKESAADPGKKIKIILDNIGKATDDTVAVLLRLKNSVGDTTTLPVLYRPSVYYRDTIIVNLGNSPIRVSGLMRCNITIDPMDLIAELTPIGEGNNYTEVNLFFPDDGIRIVFPVNDEIMSKPEARLMVQSNNIYKGEQEVMFELDTNPHFNSPVLIQSGVIKGTHFVEFKASLPPFDSTDYFWRARLNIPVSEGGEWNYGTFRYIYKSPEGWSQGYYSKIGKSELNGLRLDSNSRKLEFIRKLSGSYTIETTGANGPQERYIYGDFGLDFFGYINTNGLRILAINPDNEDRYSDGSPYNTTVSTNWWVLPGEYFKKYYTIGGKSGVYYYNTTIKTQRDSLISLINRIPVGYYILLYSGPVMGVSTWEPEVFDALKTVGISKINLNIDGHPYIATGVKGMTEGQATEVFPDFTNTTVPANRQKINQTIKLTPKVSTGDIRSKKVGPAMRWDMAYLNIDREIYDSVFTEIIAYDSNGNVGVVAGMTSDRVIDLSSINAKSYPYIELKLYLTDATNRSPADLLNWTVLFEGVPEGALESVANFTSDIDTLQENQVLSFKTAFRNISDKPMDSVWVRVTSKNYLSNMTDTIIWQSFKNLLSGDSFQISVALNTLAKVGNNELLVEVNPGFIQPEQSLANNVLIKSFFVIRDQKNPLFDVTFDGIHILNNDIVSSRPQIIIEARDDNPFVLLDEESLFSISLKSPDSEDTFRVYDQFSPEIQFKAPANETEKARLTFSPDKLVDGKHTLNVQVTDKAGNLAGSEEYSIDFQVINKSAITHFYPYPNPFTTKTRFVFTLTGDKLPDYLKIQIMTISGKIVREIMLSELGQLRIGNNITDFAWDGTDEFGDKLANGVYLYKVTAKTDGKEIDRRETSADNFFTQDIGKMYILR